MFRDFWRESNLTMNVQHHELRFRGSQVFKDVFGFSCIDEKAVSCPALAVLWDPSVLCYRNNVDLSQLVFSVSALQEWLALLHVLDMNCKNASLLADKYSAWRRGELGHPDLTFACDLSTSVFPFALFNHLLSKFIHRSATNTLVPIQVIEYSTGVHLEMFAVYRCRNA